MTKRFYIALTLLICGIPAFMSASLVDDFLIELKVLKIRAQAGIAGFKIPYFIGKYSALHDEESRQQLTNLRAHVELLRFHESLMKLDQRYKMSTTRSKRIIFREVLKESEPQALQLISLRYCDCLLKNDVKMARLGDTTVPSDCRDLQQNFIHVAQIFAAKELDKELNK